MKEVTVDGNKTLQPTNRYTCDHCKSEFNLKHILTLHIIRKHITRKCPECPLRFLPKDLVFHKHEVHGAYIPTCGICGLKNTNRSIIILHQRKVHLKEKNVQCTECDAKFFSATYLKRHMVSHNPVKQFQCRFCKKNYPRLNSLRQHEKIHTGDKRKVCHICQERFVQKASLNYHMAKHHPEAV
jgi:KRAB domain-containing zinc finger protein